MHLQLEPVSSSGVHRKRKSGRANFVARTVLTIVLPD